MTSLESLGAFAAMIFIAALTVATAFPVKGLEGYSLEMSDA